MGIADVIFGRHNPTGRLTQTWYHSSYTKEITMNNMNMRPDQAIASKSVGRGYRYYPKDVVYNFGHGMSYNTYECGDLKDNKDGTVMTTVKNTGPNDHGGAVVLVYFVPDEAGKGGKPLKRLVAFGRVHHVGKGDSVPLKMDFYSEFYEGPEYASGKGKYVVSCPL